ncbi:SHOCT domain-containing protein [Companilactobacillus muriivasis]|uniref:SHOCT domain-containing protein n=1 Tax=Companilactobacillus muriivasis TaxID=3081444 RepID=UPI0030C765EA
MHATLINRNTRERKDVKVGFSWTEFFWGFWPALFRGDWKWLVIILLVDLAFGVFTWGGGSFFFNLIFAFFYNKLYANDLLNAGFEPADDYSYNALLAKNYINPGRKFSNTSNGYTSDSQLDQLDKLKDLLDQGAITQEEYDIKKKQILGL